MASMEMVSAHIIHSLFPQQSVIFSLPVTSQIINTTQNRHAVTNLLLASFSCRCFSCLTNLQPVSSSACESFEYSPPAIAFLFIFYLRQIIVIIFPRASSCAMRFAMYMYGFLGTSRDDMWTNRISESAIFTAHVSIRCFKANAV